MGSGTKFHDLMSRLFAGFGAFNARHSYLTFFLGSLIVCGLIGGIALFEEETDIDEIWVEKGTRVRPERDFYESQWGGLPRQQFIAITPNEGTVVPFTLDALSDALEPMIVLPTPLRNSMGQGGNAISLPYEFNDDTTIPFDWDDICERAPVPSLFSATGDGTLAIQAVVTILANQTIPDFAALGITDTLWTIYGGRWQTANAAFDAIRNIGQYASLGLPADILPCAFGDGTCPALSIITACTFLLQCGNPFPPHADWSVDKLPCNRASILDCFREGNIDYPDNLLLLDNSDLGRDALFSLMLPAAIDYIVRANFAVGLAAASPFFSTPLEAWNFVTSDFNVMLDFDGPGPVPALDLGAYLTDAVQDNPNDPRFDLFSGFVSLLGATQFAGFIGYNNRPSYKSMTDDQFTMHLSTALINLENSVPVSGCQAFGLPCCYTFSGNTVPAVVFAGAFGTTDIGGTEYRTVGSTRTVMQTWDEDSPDFIDVVTAKAQAEPAFAPAAGLTDEGSSIREDIMLQFEQLYIDFYRPKWNREADSGYEAGGLYQNQTLDFLVWRSLDDVIAEGSAAEGVLIIIGYALLFLYASLSFAKFGSPCKSANLIYGRVLLAFWGVFVVGVSTLSGFGLTSLVGLKASPISTNLVPFLSLGIGVDDMFVLAHTLEYFSGEKTVLNRMKRTMAVAGPSVFLTSITNAIAFFVAYLTPIPAVQSFVLQMGITVLLNLFSLLVMFVPALVWDARRTEQRKMDCFFCVSLAGDDVPEEDDVHGEGSFVENFTRKHLAPFLALPIVKVVVILAFLGFTAGMAVNGFANVEEGLRLGDIALVGTYERDAADLQENVYLGYSGALVTVGENLFDNQEILLNSTRALQESSFISNELPIAGLSWLNSFLGAARSISADSAFRDAFGNNFVVPECTEDPCFTPLRAPHNEQSMYVLLQAYMSGSGITDSPNLACRERATNNIKPCASFNASADIITATRMTFYMQDVALTEEIVQAIEDTRSRVDAVQPAGEKITFVYGFVYQFWEQYLDIKANLFRTAGFSVLGVFIATLIFQFSPMTSLLVALVIIMIDLQLFGLMDIIGVKLNAFSVVNLAMAVGLAVEFTAHIAHVFLVRHGTREQRVAKALEEMMPPMLNGMISSLLAVVVLAFAKFPFFRQYFFGMFFAMIIVSFLNGMIFLPVVLSLIGPGSFHAGEKEDFGGTGEEDNGTAMTRLGSTDDVTV